MNKLKEQIKTKAIFNRDDKKLRLFFSLLEIHF